MKDIVYDPVPPILAFNPFLVMWTIPFMIGHAFMTSWISASARRDAKSRNTDAGQIPVPPNLQDSSDKELFA